jgi:hypothetical protein
LEAPNENKVQTGANTKENDDNENLSEINNAGTTASTVNRLENLEKPKVLAKPKKLRRTKKENAKVR